MTELEGICEIEIKMPMSIWMSFFQSFNRRRFCVVWWSLILQRCMRSCRLLSSLRPLFVSLSFFSWDLPHTTLQELRGPCFSQTFSNQLISSACLHCNLCLTAALMWKVFFPNWFILLEYSRDWLHNVCLRWRRSMNGADTHLKAQPSAVRRRMWSITPHVISLN